jgi:hypothetical protein
MVGTQTGKNANSEKYESLLMAGKDALAKGDRDTVHRLLREAVNLNPYDERAWLGLLDVLDNDEDRRVCLQNIVAINPVNAGARSLLRRYEQQAKNRATQEARRLAAEQARAQRKRRRRARNRVTALMIGLFGGVLGGILASILVYAF